MNSCSQRSDAVTKALTIPEILEHVLAFVLRRNLGLCTVICKYWSELALDQLWAYVPDLVILIRVLHGLQWLEEGECWDLADSSLGPNWKRYELYARRVRILEYTITRASAKLDAPSNVLTDRVWALLTSWGTLPSTVHTIRWRTQSIEKDFLPFVPLFHPGVKSFSLFNSTLCHPPSLVKILDSLSRLPGLQLDHFNLEWDFVRSQADPSSPGEFIAPFLRIQTGMKSLDLTESSVVFGPQTLQAVAELSNLHSLKLIWFAARLTRVNAFLSHLSQGCPRLQDLRLCWTYVLSEPENVSLNFHNLLNWKLQVLDIGPSAGRNDVRLTLADVHKMGEVWPNLKVLRVNWINPTAGDEPGVGLPLSSLALCAEYFPELEELNTVFEWTEYLDPRSVTPFKRLRKLPASEWYIPEDKVLEVADYLTALCPAGPDVLRHVGRGRRYASNRGMQVRYDACRSRWETVASLMKKAKATET